MVQEAASQVVVEWQRLHRYRPARLGQASDDQTGGCTARYTETENHTQWRRQTIKQTEPHT